MTLANAHKIASPRSTHTHTHTHTFPVDSYIITARRKRHSAFVRRQGVVARLYFSQHAIIPATTKVCHAKEIKLSNGTEMLVGIHHSPFVNTHTHTHTHTLISTYILHRWMQEK